MSKLGECLREYIANQSSHGQLQSYLQQHDCREAICVLIPNDKEEDKEDEEEEEEEYNNRNNDNILLLAWFQAIQENHINVIAALLDAGMDISVEDYHGFSALIYASKNGNEELVRLFLSHESLSPNDDGMDVDVAEENDDDDDDDDAADEEDSELMEEERLDLVNDYEEEVEEEEEGTHQYDEDYMSTESSVDEDEYYDDEEIAEDERRYDQEEEELEKSFVVGKYVPVETCHEFENEVDAAFFFACKYGHLTIARLLVEEHHANVAVEDKYDNTALVVASCNGHQEVVRWLLNEQQADANHFGDGLTSLMWAAMNGHIETAALLLNHGVHIDMTNDVGQTALMFEAQFDHYDMVRFLVRNGADVTLKNYLGNLGLVGACSLERTVIRERKGLPGRCHDQDKMTNFLGFHGAHDDNHASYISPRIPRKVLSSLTPRFHAITMDFSGRTRFTSHSFTTVAALKQFLFDFSEKQGYWVSYWLCSSEKKIIEAPDLPLFHELQLNVFECHWKNFSEEQKQVFTKYYELLSVGELIDATLTGVNEWILYELDRAAISAIVYGRSLTVQLLQNSDENTSFVAVPVLPTNDKMNARTIIGKTAFREFMAGHYLKEEENKQFEDDKFLMEHIDNVIMQGETLGAVFVGEVLDKAFIDGEENPGYVLK